MIDSREIPLLPVSISIDSIGRSVVPVKFSFRLVRVRFGTSNGRRGESLVELSTVLFQKVARTDEIFQVQAQ